MVIGITSHLKLFSPNNSWNMLFIVCFPCTSFTSSHVYCQDWYTFINNYQTVPFAQKDDSDWSLYRPWEIRYKFCTVGYGPQESYVWSWAHYPHICVAWNLCCHPCLSLASTFEPSLLQWRKDAHILSFHFLKKKEKPSEWLVPFCPRVSVINHKEGMGDIQADVY